MRSGYSRHMLLELGLKKIEELTPKVEKSFEELKAEVIAEWRAKKQRKEG